MSAGAIAIIGVTGEQLSMHYFDHAMARRVIDAGHYMTLGTADPGGQPRLSPVYYTPARYSDLYWVSSPEAQHSRPTVHA